MASQSSFDVARSGKAARQHHGRSAAGQHSKRGPAPQRYSLPARQCFSQQAHARLPADAGHGGFRHPLFQRADSVAPVRKAARFRNLVPLNYK
jgi:hypothetical protein